MYGRNYRQKAIPQIITEIQTIQRVYPDTLLLFADDNAFVLRKQAKELLRQLKGRGLRWIAQTDISAAEDEELLTLMRQAGCQWVVIGFESIQANSLRRLNATSYKARNVSSYPEKIQAIQSHGIGIYGTFIVGLDEVIYPSSLRLWTSYYKIVYTARISRSPHRFPGRNCANSCKRRIGFGQIRGRTIPCGMWSLNQKR
ncbi:MAG: hypothetical protein ACLTXL_06015 [Clostridia bacterium]